MKNDENMFLDKLSEQSTGDLNYPLWIPKSLSKYNFLFLSFLSSNSQFVTGL
jgi:hypothetical protein